MPLNKETKPNHQRSVLTEHSECQTAFGLSVCWTNVYHDIFYPSIGVKMSDIWFLFWLKWKEILTTRRGLEFFI